MNTKHLMKKLPSCLLGAILAAGIASTTMVNAVDGNPPGLFELEGNVTDEAFDETLPYTAGDDWESLFDGSNNGSPLATTEDEDSDSSTFGTLIVSDAAPKSIFTQGGSKDVSDVSAWKHTDGSVPDKDNITHAYAAAYINPSDIAGTMHKAGDMMIYFGLDRFANNGDAFAGFWFFQNEVKAGPNGTFVDSAGNPAVHVAMQDDPDSDDPTKFLPGDMFVNVEYPQASGAVPIIRVYQWDPLDADGDGNADPDEKGGKFSPLDLVIKSSDAECDQAGNKLACAISNLVALNEPSWGYTPKSGTGLPFESFFEGGINVTQLLGSTPCFASFLAETRSSASQTAQLKDFVLASFPVCGIDVEKECSAALLTTEEGGTDVKVSFFGTVENDGAGSYTAYLKDSLADAEITDVCLYVEEEIGGEMVVVPCGENGATSVTPTLQADGSAFFPLAGNEKLRFEGEYIVDGLPSVLTLSDTVTALAFADADDVPAPGEAEQEGYVDLSLVDDADTAECAYAVNPELMVTKQCTVAFIGGSSASLTIEGTVKNDGDVPISNLRVWDTDFADDLVLKVGGVVVTSLEPGETGTYKLEVPNVPYDSELLGKTVDDLGGGLFKVTLTHSDTVNAEGVVLASDGTQLDTTDSSGTSLECSDDFTRGIKVEKVCNDVVLEPNGDGRLVVKVKVTATVTNIGEEDLSGIVLSDDPAVAFVGAPTELAAGADPVPVEGTYYPESEAVLTDLTSLTFPDTASVTANGVFSSAAMSDDSEEVNCALCPTE
ncbi:MAG: hypothetical protein Q8P85_13945 [Pseudomonas sp.]|nr:hypothetical protein [Pseudomonas sp.]